MDKRIYKVDNDIKVCKLISVTDKWARQMGKDMNEVRELISEIYQDEWARKAEQKISEIVEQVKELDYIIADEKFED